MSCPDRPVAKSYDEIVRSTVPDPDSSQRPTERQEELAREGFRQMDDHETALASRVRSAISGEPDVEVEVDRETVTLRGHVRDARVIARLEEIVNRIEGVTSVNNRLVVGA